MVRYQASVNDFAGCHIGKGHAHRDTVLRFLKADIEATALMQRDRQVFNAALAKWFNIMDPRDLMTQREHFAPQRTVTSAFRIY
jgi:hypothetical protein